MKDRDAERQRLMDELAPLTAMADRTASWSEATLRRALHDRLGDWRGLVEGHVEEARRLLDAALTDRLTFTKEGEQNGQEIWAISAPIGWDRLLARLAPETFAGLKWYVASPNGTETYCHRVYELFLAAA